MHLKTVCSFLFLFLLTDKSCDVKAQATTKQQVEQTMLRATKYMVEQVSTNGGYVWYYLPDLSRRWGEMEAYKTMVWVQDAGTVGMGHLFLDAYSVTKNKFYLNAAAKAASALIRGQSKAGGWNYMVDFAGEASLKNWYRTIGKNGWRLEEFQHYYGNDTYDDDVTSDAARFLLRMFLLTKQTNYKAPLYKAIAFILKSQYPAGGWPQRYPLKYDFKKSGHPDYTSFYTFNDDVIWENLNFLIQCYQTLGEERFSDPVRRAMDFYVKSQTLAGGWAQQYNLQMKPAGARTYEPVALLPSTTFNNALLLCKFYEYTGDRKFLERVPLAVSWLDKTRLPAEKTENGNYTHPRFVDVETGNPVYVHRKGSNVIYGYYYTDTIDQKLLAHYSGKAYIKLDRLIKEYERVQSLSREEIIKNSPLKILNMNERPDYKLSRESDQAKDTLKVNISDIINALDDQNRWLVKHAMTSNSYIGDGRKKEATDSYASTYVGDETDTSPYRDSSDQLYISTAVFIRNMKAFIGYLSEQ